MLAVLLALVAAELATLSARLEERSTQRRLEGGLAGQEFSSRGADVSAVEIETNTADQGRHLLLTETGVSAGGTGLSTVKAGADALDQCIDVNRRFLRSRLCHWLCVRHLGSKSFL